MMIELIVCVVIVLVLIGVIFVTKAKQQKKINEINNELEFFKKEREYYNEAMFLLSDKAEIIYANLAAKKLFGLQEDNISGKYLIHNKIQIKYKNSTNELFEVLSQKIKEPEDTTYLKNVVLVASGDKIRASIYLDKNGLKINKTVTCIIDTQPVEEHKVEEEGGRADFLTGLPSQFVSLSDINTLVIDSKRNSETFSLMLLGIDHFDELQVALGHTHINQIIKKISNYFIENPVANRKVYRMDCDKFLIRYKHIDNNEIAHDVAKQVIIDLNNYFKDEENIRLSISLGIVIYPNHGQNATKLINNVYIALDEAQKSGESNILISEEAKLLTHKDEQRLNEEIKKAIRKDEFILHYQPTFDIGGEQMIGAEALLRWKHPEHGLITPDKFLDVAHKTGLIVDIGEYVFDLAITQRKEWDKKGFKKLKISINLSLKDIQVDELVEKLEKLFRRHSVSPSEFNLDISEKDAMKNIEKTIEDCNKFRELGLSIALDQFGVSYSSFKHLQMLPLSTIKIDRSLIFDIASNSDHKIAVEAMVKMAHTMSYSVVAEGVETSKELEILKDMGCEYAQGYLFARPMSVLDFQELLKEEDE
jgi:diguanylate cyclase (GGDEF)-like protein/PAS domain S-box-containing protein